MDVLWTTASDVKTIVLDHLRQHQSGKIPDAAVNKSYPGNVDWRPVGVERSHQMLSDDAMCQSMSDSRMQQCDELDRLTSVCLVIVMQKLSFVLISHSEHECDVVDSVRIVLALCRKRYAICCVLGWVRNASVVDGECDDRRKRFKTCSRAFHHPETPTDRPKYRLTRFVHSRAFVLDHIYVCGR